MSLKLTRFFLAAAFATASAFAFALPIHADVRCPMVVGTYLTTVSIDVDPGSATNLEYASRGIMTLRGDGTVDLSDSAQQGKNADFDPFGESKGVYICQQLPKKEVNIKASLINFTMPGLTTDYPTPDISQAIARTDYDLNFDAKTQTFNGTITVYLFTMETDLDNADNPDPLTNTLNATEGPFLYFVKGRKAGVVK